MRGAKSFAAVLLTMGAVAGWAQQSVAPQMPDEALQLLDKVGQHYRDAEAVHLAATIVSTTHSDLSEGMQKDVMSIYVAQGNRFRYDGTNAQGSGMIVSDGTTEWRLLRGFGEYVKAPTGAFMGSRIVLSGDNSAIVRTRSLLPGLRSLGGGIRAAHMGEPETIEVGGRKVQCVVVSWGTADFTRNTASGGNTVGETVWIDPATLTVVKQEAVSHVRPVFQNRAEPFAAMTTHVTTTEFSVTDLNFEPDDKTFAFNPPAGSREVAKLTGETQPNTAGLAPVGQRPEDKATADHLNKPLPEITLNDAAGNPVAFSKYLGHPLLIDVWATWCAPCMSEMPTMNKIRLSTAQTDLQILGVDEDTHTEDSTAFLKRRGYDWEDLHYNRDFARQLSVVGVPLTVLVNNEGTVVYFHVGAGHAKDLAEAIAKLGPQYASVRVE